MFGKKREEQYFEKKKVNAFIFVVYLILGIYFINFHFQFYPIPETVSNFDSWIIFVGGLFMFLGSIHYFQSKRN